MGCCAEIHLNAPAFHRWNILAFEDLKKHEPSRLAETMNMQAETVGKDSRRGRVVFLFISIKREVDKC